MDARGVVPDRQHVPVPALVPLRPAAGVGDAPPLVMVTAGYGDLMALTQLARLLKGDFPIYALQPPVPPPSSDAGGYVATYVGALRAAHPDGPYRLFGYSTGGLMAFFIAQSLVTSGARVPLLVLLDAPCGISRPFAAAHRAARRLLGGWLTRNARRLGSAGQIAARMVADAGLAAHVNALEHATPAPYGGDALLVLPEAPRWARPFQQAGRWRKVVRGRVAVDRVPGNHNSCLRPPHVAALAACLDRRLGAAPA
ncbi:MAG TPA: thioesterase domain-containing protein [Chloroflexota bacterium]|nr:thioesterase domain-containing protein [Chloroflexota bacterium]